MDRQRQTGSIYIDLELHSFIIELQRHVNFYVELSICDTLVGQRPYDTHTDRQTAV